MSNLRLYITVAAFLVLVITACYLEFPVVTALILVFVIVIYLCSSDGRGISGFVTRFGNNKRERGGFSTGLSARLTTSILNPKNKRREANRPALLTGVSAFSLEVCAKSNWRNPLLQRRAFAIAKSTLVEQALFCSNKEEWLRQPDIANLKVEILLDEYQREIRLTVLLEVIGKITITRANASISEAAVLWKNTVPRLTNQANLSYDLEEALTTAFNALLRDYFATFHGSNNRNSERNTQGKICGKRLPPQS